MKDINVIANTVRPLALAVLAAISSPLAFADDAGWYIGGNVGQSSAKIDNAGITRNLLSSGFTTTSITNDNRATGYKLFGGYQYNKNFAVEAGYYDLGRFGYTATTTPVGAQTGSIKLKGLNLDALGMLPISEKFSAFGRLGLNYSQAQDTFTGSGAIVIGNPSPSKNELNYKFGAGLQYALTESVDVRGEVERYRVNDAVNNKGDIDLVSVGLVYRFGKKSPERAPVKDTTPPTVTLAIPANNTFNIALERRVRVAFSEPMDPATINAQTVTLSQGKTPVAGKVTMPNGSSASIAQDKLLLPNTVYTAKVTTGVKDLAGNALAQDYVWNFETAPIPNGKVVIINKFVMLEDTHFKFDEAALTPAGEEMLKTNIKIMKDNPSLKVRIAGYTSAAGTADYNQNLSERRAEAVRAYLIKQGGIAPERLDTIGYGDTRPKTYEPFPSDIDSKAAKSNRRVLFEVMVK